MATLRRHVRLWALAWFFCQAASVTALMPRDCCASHRPAEAASCHEPPATTHCTMRGADGAPCPMHRVPDAHASDAHDGPPAEPRCVIGSTCAGPSFFSLLSQPGLPAVPVTLSPVDAVGDDRSMLQREPIFAPHAPDPPPPRR